MLFPFLQNTLEFWVLMWYCHNFYNSILSREYPAGIIPRFPLYSLGTKASASERGEAPQCDKYAKQSSWTRDRVSSTPLDKPILTRKVFWPHSVTAVFFPIVFISHKCFWAPMTTFVPNLKIISHSLTLSIWFLFQKALAEVAKWCEVIFQDDSSTWRKFRLWL